jgi:hypothetical protein
MRWHERYLTRFHKDPIAGTQVHAFGDGFPQERSPEMLAEIDGKKSYSSRKEHHP